jgi:hypothetical protein
MTLKGDTRSIQIHAFLYREVQRVVDEQNQPGSDGKEPSVLLTPAAWITGAVLKALDDYKAEP